MQLLQPSWQLQIEHVDVVCYDVDCVGTSTVPVCECTTFSPCGRAIVEITTSDSSRPSVRTLHTTYSNHLITDQLAHLSMPTSTILSHTGLCQERVLLLGQAGRW